MEFSRNVGASVFFFICVSLALEKVRAASRTISLERRGSFFFIYTDVMGRRIGRWKKKEDHQSLLLRKERNRDEKDHHHHHFMKRRNGRCDVYESVRNPAFVVLLYRTKGRIAEATKKTSPRKTITLVSNNQPTTHPHTSKSHSRSCANSNSNPKSQKPSHCIAMFSFWGKKKFIKSFQLALFFLSHHPQNNFVSDIPFVQSFLRKARLALVCS